MNQRTATSPASTLSSDPIDAAIEPALDVGGGPMLASLTRCWVCGGSDFRRIEQFGFDHAAFGEQDPELASYTGLKFWIQKCSTCSFMQPDSTPTLPNYFDRMYDTRWSTSWMETEFESGYKDFIFRRVLHALRRRCSSADASFLDVGAHVGRLMTLAAADGWKPEGIELNPRTAAFAASRTGLPVHQMNAHSLANSGRRYAAITFIDVLEHIPEPVQVLKDVYGLLKPGGWIAVKVPFGRNQLLKERVRGALRKGSRRTVAMNQVHINHFSPRSLRTALAAAGYDSIRVETGAPEGSSLTYHLTFQFCRLLPGGVHTPLAMNLQAYARRPH